MIRKFYKLEGMPNMILQNTKLQEYRRCVGVFEDDAGLTEGNISSETV